MKGSKKAKKQDEKQQDEVQKKVLKIYYKEQLQTIHYYPGTTQTELEQTIRSLFDISKNSYLIFLDEDGIPLAISQTLPTNLQLSLQVKPMANEEFKIDEVVQNQPQQVNNDTIISSGNLKFIISESCTNYRPTLAEDGKMVTNIQMDTPMTALRINLKIEKKKKYYFQYTFETLTCCMSAYFFTEFDRQGEQSNIAMQFGCTSTNSKETNVIVGIAIDTVNKKWHIVNPTTQKSVKHYFINPDWENPQMALWTKHNDAVGRISDLMDYPSYL